MKLARVFLLMIPVLLIFVNESPFLSALVPGGNGAAQTFTAENTETDTSGETEIPDEETEEEASEPENPAEETESYETQPEPDEPGLPDNEPNTLPGTFASQETPVVIDSLSIVVYTYDQLDDALRLNNGYTHIYLGDNITMTGGITVSSAKHSFVIDGINPLDPGAGRHTLTEHPVAALASTIYIGYSAIKEATLKNLIIVGKNFFGTIGVLATCDVTLTYENIDYSGPQLSYNRIGTCRYINSVINVTTNNGGPTAVEELCETKHVVFGGRVTVNGSNTLGSLIWFLGSDCTLTVLDSADVRLNIQGNYMIFSDGGAVSCTIGRDASLSVTSRYGLFYNSSATLHQFQTLTIEEYGSLEVTHLERSPTLAPTIKVRSGLTVMPGGSLKVSVSHASAYPLIEFMTSNGNAVFQDPDAVVLTNRTGSLFEWQIGSGTVDITADAICYWVSAASPQESAGFAQMPTRYWSKASGAPLNIRAAISLATITGVTTDFISGVDSGTVPDKTSFNLSAAHMLSFGRLPLIPDPPAADAGFFTGSTAQYADIRLEHSAFDVIYDRADAGGLIYTYVPLLDYPGSIQVTAQRELLFKTVTVDVLPPQPLKTLELTHVPEHMPFGIQPISSHPLLCSRAVSEWTVLITDTRDFGSPWSLYVRVSSPLSGDSGPLPDALVYVNASGGIYTLDGEGRKIASGEKDSAEHMIKLVWTAGEGVLLSIPPGRAHAKQYTAILEWILTDAP